jgi:hypothetical protein
MRLNRAVLAVLFATIVLAVPVLAQAPAGMPPVPKPGPEQELFKQDEGTWDATVESFMAPGAPPMTSKAVETNAVGCGGLCLVTDFKGDFGGMPFHGHGTTAYDSVKKKYVGSWTDSMSTGLLIGESTYDPAKKTVTGYMEGPDMTGKVASRSPSSSTSPTARVCSRCTCRGPTARKPRGMRITTKRK